jgi:Tfp pilus assembly protein PilW
VTAPSLSDERGTTMVELLVGMAMGMIVLVGLSMTIITVLHGTSRVDARVEATDNARIAVTRIMEELHSACISPQIAPVRQNSTGTSLIFWHAASSQGEKVQPTPVKSAIVYSNGTLTQTDYAQVGGTAPNWTFEGEGGNHGTGSTRTLLSDVAPGLESGSVFAYEKYEAGSLKPLSAAGLSEAEAKATIVVKVALTASPRSSPVADAGSAATVDDSATLRLTPPSFNQAVSAPPCQ